MKKALILIPLGLLIMLIGFGAFDYEINEALFNRESRFGLIMIYAPYLTAYILAYAAIMLVLRFMLLVRVKSYVPAFTATFALFLMITYFFIFSFNDKVRAPMWEVPIFLAGVLILSALLIRRIDKRNLLSFFKMASIYLFSFFMMKISVNLVKTIIYRVRFEYLRDASEFQPWYLPEFSIGSSHAINSFPSGHTASGAMIMVIVLIPIFIPKFKKLLIPLGLIAFGWSVASAMGRIVLGKHYPSDTIFAMLMVYGIFLLAYKMTKTLFVVLDHNYSRPKPSE